MWSMLSTTRAILAELKTVRIVSTILLGRVITFLAVAALKCNDRSNVLLF